MTDPAEIIPEHLRELIARHTNATIERCAQVAEQMAWSNKNTRHLGPEQNCVAVAAAIRKLKEPAVDPNIVHPGSDHPGPFPQEEP